MTRPDQIKPARSKPVSQYTGLSVRFAAAGLCAITAGFALTGTIQYLSPRTMPAVLPFAETFHSQALSAPADEGPAFADLALKAAPARGELEALKAYTLIRQTGTITPAALEALRASYSKSPLSPAAHETRLSLIYSYWPHMPVDLRRQANTEARIYARRYSGRKFLQDLRPNLPPAAVSALDLSLSQAALSTR